MTLDDHTRTTLASLAATARGTREASDEAQAALVAALRDARPYATVRELGEITGLSHQRVDQLTRKGK